MIAAFPTALHLGPATIHLYGIGLATAAYVTFRYAERRLACGGLDIGAWSHIAVWAIISGLVGARLAHVATNWSYYSAVPQQIPAVWEGGLSSFGGIVVATPVVIVLARRAWPEVALLEIADRVIPALVAGWALGRLLGPQFMVGGGGHETTAWFGMTYEGQGGKRVPVPLIQAMEDGLLWLGLLWSEKRVPRGVVTGLALFIWGLVRSIDERLLLGESGHVGSLSVQIAGITVAVAGGLIILQTLRSQRKVKN